jgi:hypothetical protein
MTPLCNALRTANVQRDAITLIFKHPGRCQKRLGVITTKLKHVESGLLAELVELVAHLDNERSVFCTRAEIDFTIARITHKHARVDHRGVAQVSTIASRKHSPSQLALRGM